ncbi:MAG: hypothetical protein DRZ76_02470 [Candidatus Nealsonbacteria bacterium]|nr:MAG: hypothetical protein DRZ76_02470 [Candidatus Nealsonbacteria bacterium]
MEVFEGILVQLLLVGLLMVIFLADRELRNFSPISWYEEGIGGYSFSGGGGYGPYTMVEVNPFDYPFESMPSGTFNPDQPLSVTNLWLSVILAFLPLTWVLIVIPDMDLKFFAMAYLILFSAPSIVSGIEILDPVKSRGVAVVSFGYGAFLKQMLMGLLAAMPFVYLCSLNIYKISTLFQIEGAYAATAILSVLAVPVVEEELFRDVVGFSVAEKLGWVPGALFSSALFALFHSYVYSLSLHLMLLSFAFGVVVQIIDYKYKSVLPGYIAHILVNASAVL